MRVAGQNGERCLSLFEDIAIASQLKPVTKAHPSAKKRSAFYLRKSKSINFKH